jgi:hypothetical protein
MLGQQNIKFKLKTFFLTEYTFSPINALSFSKLSWTALY